MAGSMARRRRRLRLTESPELELTPELRDMDTPAATITPSASTSALQPRQPRDRSKKKRRRRERSRAAKDRSEEDRTARIYEWIRGGDEEVDTDQAEKKDDVAEDQEKMKDEDDVAGDDDEVVSSAPSSPLRAPVMPDEHRFNYDPVYEEAFKRVEARYKEKTARQMKLPTLDQYKPRGRRVKELKPVSIRDSERKTVLRAAKFVVAVSSSVGGEPRRGSGFWIEWDEDKKTGIVLTTADLIASEYRHRRQEYAEDAEVLVHLRDDTTAKAHLLYYHKHYNLALFRVTVDQPVQLPSFSEELHYDQEIFELGRDEHLYLRVGPGRVKYKHYNFSGEYHCMGILGGHEDFEHKEGGPVIDLDGNVVGMVMWGSFIPSSVLLKCLHLWRKYRCIPRPHLGLQLCAIRDLDLSIVEKISVKCNIDEGLIVKEVSKRSYAEKLGIRVGDVIECFNGECIGNTVELENLLLSVCESHLDKGNEINSKVDILIKVFHTRKGRRTIKTLVANLSECKEDIGREYYPFTIEEGVSASDSLDEVSSD